MIVPSALETEEEVLPALPEFPFPEPLLSKSSPSYQNSSEDLLHLTQKEGIAMAAITGKTVLVAFLKNSRRRRSSSLLPFPINYLFEYSQVARQLFLQVPRQVYKHVVRQLPLQSPRQVV